MGITLDEYRSLVAAPDSTLEVMTSEEHDHKHKLLVGYVAETEKFEYTSCDDLTLCWDGHPVTVTLISDVDSKGRGDEARKPIPRRNFVMSKVWSDQHTHQFSLTEMQIQRLKDSGHVGVLTSETQGHTHTLE